MDLLDRMLEHDRWAMAQLLERSRDLTDEQLDRPFDIGHRTLRDTYAHLIDNIDFWTALMNGRPLEQESAAQERDGSVPGLAAWYEQAFTDFAATAREVRDEQRLDDTFVDHFGERPTLGTAIIHVTAHNLEHRSEALHILTRLGVPDPPEIDPLLWDHVGRARERAS